MKCHLEQIIWKYIETFGNKGSHEQVWKFALFNDFLFLFSGHDSSVRLWNLETKTCIQEITAHRKKFDESIFDVAFHPSRPYIASAGADALAKVFVWKVDKNCKETPKMMKRKSNRKTLNKNNSKQNNWIRARSEYNALSCDILWQFLSPILHFAILTTWLYI